MERKDYTINKAARNNWIKVMHARMLEAEAAKKSRFVDGAVVLGDRVEECLSKISYDDFWALNGDR